VSAIDLFSKQFKHRYACELLEVSDIFHFVSINSIDLFFKGAN